MAFMVLNLTFAAVRTAAANDMASSPADQQRDADQQRNRHLDHSTITRQTHGSPPFMFLCGFCIPLAMWLQSHFCFNDPNPLSELVMFVFRLGNRPPDLRTIPL